MKIKLKLKKIDPVKAAVINGLLLALLSLLVVVPMMLFISASGVSRGGMNPYNAGVIFGGGITMVFILPIIYGILGFILGLIGTALFNFILSKTNGLNIEFDSDSLEIDQIGKKEDELKF